MENTLIKRIFAKSQVMSKYCFFFFLFIGLSLKSTAQFDLSFSLDYLKAPQQTHYFQYLNTNQFTKSTNSLSSLPALTTYLKYNFIKGNHTGLSIGIPFGFDLRNSKNGPLYQRHYHAMVDINTGSFIQGFRSERIQRFSFYFGLGVGYFKSDVAPTYTNISYDSIPVAAKINYADTTKMVNGRLPNEKSLSSFGVMAHFGVSFNWFCYCKPLLFLLPTGLRISSHMGTDRGGSFYSVGLLYSTKTLYPFINKITRSGRDTKYWMSL